MKVYKMAKAYTLTAGGPMRTNIVIDDQLMAEALRISGARTKRQAVEDGLRLLIQLKSQEQVRNLRGKVRWTGDLDTMRRDRREVE